MLEHTLLYFIPEKGEILKIQPGTGDNLSPEDIEAGYSDYVIWNRFRPVSLDIDGELEMECVDSGMVLLKMDPIAALQDDMRGRGQDDEVERGQDDIRDGTAAKSMFPVYDVLGKALNYAYGQNTPDAIPLLW